MGIKRAVLPAVRSAGVSGPPPSSSFCSHVPRSSRALWTFLPTTSSHVTFPKTAILWSTHSSVFPQKQHFAIMRLLLPLFTVLSSTMITAFRTGNPSRIIGSRLMMGVRKFNSEEPPPPFPSIDALSKQLQQQKNGGGFASVEKESRNAIEKTVTFPTSTFIIKVIGINEPSFASDIVNCVAVVVNETPENISVETKVTSGGKYMSISITPTFQAADEIYKVYAAVQADSRVKFVI